MYQADRMRADLSVCAMTNLSFLVHWFDHAGRSIRNELICFHLSKIHCCMLRKTGKYCHRADVNLKRTFVFKKGILVSFQYKTQTETEIVNVNLSQA